VIETNAAVLGNLAGRLLALARDGTHLPERCDDS
jgi:hypothetical protein